MNYLKKMGIAAMLAVAAMAIVGAGNAAAEQSVFCKVNETPCASANQYPEGTEVLLTSKGSIKWVSEEGGEFSYQQECWGADFKGEITAAGGEAETVEVSFTSQFLSGCRCPLSNLQNAKMKFNWTSGTMNGSVTSQGPEYSFHCNTILFGTHTCVFGGEIKEGVTLTGGNPAILAINEAPVEVTGSTFPCGSQATLSVEFEVEKPNPLYVSYA